MIQSKDATDAIGAGPSAVALQGWGAGSFLLLLLVAVAFSYPVLWLSSGKVWKWGSFSHCEKLRFMGLKWSSYMVPCENLCYRCHSEQHWFLHWISKGSENWETCWIFLPWMTSGAWSLIFVAGWCGYPCCWRQPHCFLKSELICEGGKIKWASLIMCCAGKMTSFSLENAACN